MVKIEERLRKLLASHGIETSLWGIQEGTKTLKDLAKEISEGESIIQKMNGNLLRETIVLYAHVRCGEYLLYEDRQEFKNGSVRKRNDLKGSIAEKLKKGEILDKDAALLRAMNEELGLHSDDISSLSWGVPWIEYSDSPSYPGLSAMFICHTAYVEIKETAFKIDGYIEKQKNKTTFFLWVKNKK
jgi:hypothetical protein